MVLYTRESIGFPRSASLLKGYSGSLSNPSEVPQETTVWSPFTVFHPKNPRALQESSRSSPRGRLKDVKFQNQGQPGKV